MDKYGFVYRWYDQKHDRYYIGCHWGTDFDGYICSSNWMRNSYKKRPQDFKRELLRTNIPSKQEMIDEEYRWLQTIHPEELGKRYYNLIRQRYRQKEFQHSEEMKEHLRKTRFRHTPEAIEKIRQSKLGNQNGLLNKGKVRTEETRQKIAATLKGNIPWNKGQKMSKEEKAQKKLIYQREYRARNK